MAFPDVSTRSSAADGTPVVVPACTTCPVRPNVVGVVVDVDVDGDVGESDELPHPRDTHAAARHKKIVRIDIISGHRSANVRRRCNPRTAAEFL
jgi:hypothetical protein